jgi:hypothetical protein
MASRMILRAAAGCAALTVFASIPAHAQFGAIRRAATRAVASSAASSANSHAAAATAPPASSVVGTGDVLEMTAAVLDRFQRALAAESADRAATARQLAALQSTEQYNQCESRWMMSAQGQGWIQKLSAATGDQQAAINVANQMKAALAHDCGADPSERDRIESDAPIHAEKAGVAAGEFNPRQYAVLKERAVPFCRAPAEAGQGDVRLQSMGSIYWVYTAAEAAALRDRCGALMQAISANS